MIRLRAALLLAALALPGCLLVRMRPQSSGTSVATDDVRANVERHVRALSFPRNTLHRAAYFDAVAYVREALSPLDYVVYTEPVMGDIGNVYAELPGGPGTVVLAAHYDSCYDAGGADDNASGVAAMLEVARLLGDEVAHGRTLAHTVRFVAFANEEPPWFMRRGMGSLVHAANARARDEDLVAVLALDGVGYYSDAPGSQAWPAGLGLVMPRRANFIAVVSRGRSRRQVATVTDALRRHGTIPIVGAAVPTLITGVDWSDHWSFWRHGYDAVMLTDMPVFRNPHYHEPTDLPDTLDFDRLARFTAGLAGAVGELAGG